MDGMNYAARPSLLLWMAVLICGHTSAYAQESNNIRLVADALVMTRSEVASQPIIYDVAMPFGNPLLDASDVNFDTIWAGRIEATLHDVMHLGFLQTETAIAQETRSASPANVLFFGAIDASPVDTYTARYNSEFWNGDVSVANRIHPNVGVWAGVGFAELDESFDFVDPLAAVTTGFFSDTKNKMIGFHVGSDIVIRSKGSCRFEGGINGGIYNNDIEVFADTRTIDRRWSQDETAFIGGANIAWVIPFWPVDFRIGYQAIFLTGVALAPDQSASFNLFTNAGTANVGDVVYHGGILGIEFVR